MILPLVVIVTLIGCIGLDGLDDYDISYDFSTLLGLVYSNASLTIDKPE